MKMPLMTNESDVKRSEGRYGPLGFVVALVHILVVDVATLGLMPYSIFLVLPVVLVYMAVAAVIALFPGKAGQVGRGMLFGSLSGPLSALIFVSAWAVAKGIGPI